MESVAELLKWVLELLGSHNLYGYRELFYSLSL